MRIAVVDGYTTGRFLVERLNALGARCVHVRSEPEAPAVYARVFDPTLYEVDLGHHPGVDATARAVRAAGADRVVAGCESGVVLADLLADRLGLPGNRVEQVRARRDKHEMAACLRRAGLDAPRGERVTSVEQAAGWYAASGCARVVVKPVSSAGTDNVRVCRNEHEVRRACERVLASRDFFGHANAAALVQELLEGTEYYVNSVSVGGTHKAVETWVYRKAVGRCGAPVYLYEEPADPSCPDTSAVLDYTRRALDALGITDGAAHSEVMLTARGPVLVETGARLGGGVLPWVTERFTGASQVSVLATALTDPDGFARFDDRRVRWSQHVRNVSLVNDRYGTVAGWGWRERVESLPSALAVVSRVKPGAEIGPTFDLASAPGFVYLASPSQARVERDYATLREWERHGLYLWPDACARGGAVPDAAPDAAPDTAPDSVPGAVPTVPGTVAGR